jgi:phosphoribosylamine--glycine ligase
MATLGERVDLPENADFAALGALAQRLAVDLVVCGPEGPLSQGLADRMESQGLPTFGPRQAAAALEASKEFAKEVMRAAGVPTAAFTVVADEAGCRAAARKLLATRGGVVLKASGLAAGKGVFVCFDEAGVENGLKHLYHSSMKDAAARVVVEEVLQGRECSYFTLIGDDGATGLGFAVDYKRLHDGDAGPNTGGMGCYAPVPWLPANAGERVERTVVRPLLAELKRRGLSYRGCLYVGVMWENGADGTAESGAPSVVEFNVRFGDPEAQVLAAYDDRDWLALMAAKAGLPVDPETLRHAMQPVSHRDVAVAVVMASAGYPYGGAEAGDAALPAAVFKPRRVKGGLVQVFAASVRGAREPFATGSGRVLTVTGRAPTYADARDAAYEIVGELGRGWAGCQWRRDVAGRAADQTL